MVETPRSPLFVLTVSVAALFAAVLVRLGIDPLVATSFPFLTIFGAIAIAEWVGGKWAAIAVAAAGYIVAAWLFVEPRGGLNLDLAANRLSLLLYSSTAAILIGIGELTWRARRVSQEATDLARRQKELLELTLRSIGDAVMTTDAHDRVVYVNPVAAALTGWSAEQAIGQPLSAVLEIVDETTREPLGSPAHLVTPNDCTSRRLEHTILVTRDHRERRIEMNVAPILSMVAPVGDTGGVAATEPAPAERHHTLGAVIVFRDVTARREADELLRKNEERLRLAQTIARIGMFELDLPTGIVHASPQLAAMYGQEPVARDATSDEWHAVVHPDDRDEVAKKTMESLATGSFEHEFRIVWPDGSVHWMAGRASALPDERGNRTRMLGINIDITEQKRAEEALREADRNKDQFLATLAHELRNPLAPVRTALDIMKEGAGDPQVVEKARAVMDRQVAHLVRLIDDLLDVSRITRNRLELRKERIELVAVLEQAIETSRPLFDQAGQKLTIHVPAEPIFLDGDSVRLAQVFGNLLTNASKYTESGGHIELDARCEDGDVHVRVRDDGVGIPADKLPRVFDMFTQINRSLSRSQGGLGIGLALVKTLVELHGGSVAASSAGPGCGSEFFVRLPLAVGAKAAKEEQMDDPTMKAARRILVVDDNEDAATTLAMLLQLKGSDTRMAHDGLEAVEQAATFRPDVILLDIGLPKMDGYDACRAIREQPWGSAIKMIALTGWGQEEDRRKSLEAGFDLHLVKPVAPSALIKMLAEN